MSCPKCTELEKRIRELEAKIAQLTGTRVKAAPAPPKPEPVAAAAPAKVSAKAAAVASPDAAPTAPIPVAATESPTSHVPAAMKPEESEALTRLGFSPEDHDEAVRALREYPRGLNSIAPFASKILAGHSIFHAAYAAERFSKESVERVVTKHCGRYQLEAVDIPHASEADRTHGPEAAEMALQLGYRKRDIVFASEVIKMWPSPKMGKDMLEKMKKLFERVRADVEGEDLRYCAMAYKNLGEEFLERAIRERHPKNEREVWARGISIPYLAWAYKLSAPHTGPAIDDVKMRGTRRDKMGPEVLSIVGRKFGRKIGPPPWLGGGQD